MFLNIHRLFLMAVPDKVILSIFKLLFAEPVLLIEASFLIVLSLLSYGIESVLLRHLVVSLVYNFLSIFFFIKLCSPL